MELVKTYGYAEPCDVSWVDDWVMVRDDPGLVIYKEIFKEFGRIFGGENTNYPIEISREIVAEKGEWSRNKYPWRNEYGMV